MDTTLISSIGSVIAFVGTVVAMSMAYRSWRERKLPAYWGDLEAQRYFSRRALWQKLENVHVRLFRSEVITAREFDTSIRDMKSWIHRHSSDVDEQDIIMANEYVEVVIRAFSEAEQVFGFQQYYLSPRRTPYGPTLEEVRTKLHRRLCADDGQHKSRAE